MWYDDTIQCYDAILYLHVFKSKDTFVSKKKFWIYLIIFFSIKRKNFCFNGVLKFEFHFNLNLLENDWKLINCSIKIGHCLALMWKWVVLHRPKKSTAVIIYHKHRHMTRAMVKTMKNLQQKAKVAGNSRCLLCKHRKSMILYLAPHTHTDWDLYRVSNNIWKHKIFKFASLLSKHVNCLVSTWILSFVYKLEIKKNTHLWRKARTVHITMRYVIPFQLFSRCLHHCYKITLDNMTR